MSRFSPILSRMNEKLMLPQPLKYRIMKEIAADLEDTYAFYIGQGSTEAEAETKALEKVAADDGVIDQLIEIHESPIRKMLRKLSKKMRYTIEISLWLSLVALVGMVVYGLVLRSDTFAQSPFNWITGAFLVGMAGISGSKYYELYVKREYAIETIHRGLPLLIFISCLALLTSTLGFFVELQQSINITIGSWDTGQGGAARHLYRCLAVISFGFATAVIGAIMWFRMTLTVLSLEDHEHEGLLAEME
jgi:hypothetical protein